MNRILVLIAAASVMLAGCSMTGTYQSARVLEKGTSSFGLSFGSITIEPSEEDLDSIDVEDSKLTIPSLLPDITFRTALSDNFEVGGKASIGSLGFEGDVKWGFLQGERFCMAFAPALFGQNMLFMKGGGFRLPVLASYDFNDNFSIHGSLFTSYSNLSSDNNGIDSLLSQYVGEVNANGGSLGLEFSGETFLIRPVVEVSRVSPVKPEEVEWNPFNRTRFVLHLGFLLGREKKQLDRIEEKIDKLN